MKLIFGSAAAKHWFSDFRDPKDIDFICEDTSLNCKETEYHWNPAFQYILDNNKDGTYVDANFLYTIKFSHAPWNVRWGKTMRDIKFFKEKGCEIDWELCKLLRKDWNVIHGKKHINLNKKTDEFFDDKVTRKYKHDELHELLAFNKVPMHHRIRKDDTPMCYKELWDLLAYDDKIKCALEEVYVVVAERYIRKYPFKIAKEKAMKNLITSMTQGWFNDFLIDNFDEILYNEYDRLWSKKLEIL